MAALTLGATILFLLALATLYFLPRWIAAPRPSAPIRPDTRPFPDGFLWATGEDAYQHEGGNTNADWYDWERGDPRPFADGSVAGDCVDFYNRYEEDFQRSKADGQNAHRIGIEWSRVEPEEGRYDEEAWVHYRAMLRSLKDKGFTVFVNLWHFTLPRWAAAKGGWLDDGVFARWEAYAAEAARRLGDLVDYWSTMIDAQIYVLRGWFIGDIPPLKRDPAEGLRVFLRLLDAHAVAYRAIKAAAGAGGVSGATRGNGDGAPRAGAAPRVGMIYFFSICQSAGNPLDNVVCGQFDAIFNRAFPDALHTGTARIAMLGGLRVRRSNDGWRGTLDWLGVNYYYREILSFSPGTIGFLKRSPGPGTETTDTGWEIYPEGIHRLCGDLAARYPGVPLVIAENGLADASDSRRPRFIVEHVAWTRRLVDEGLPVFGYTHWSLTDNLEWTEGFAPKFGLYRVDRATQRRVETRSARLFRFIASRNRLPTPEEAAAIE